MGGWDTPKKARLMPSMLELRHHPCLMLLEISHMNEIVYDSSLFVLFVADESAEIWRPADCSNRT